MQRRVVDFNTLFGDELMLRIGIDTGPVVAGVIGKKKFIYDVWGDTVNTASRMESHSEPGKIHVTHRAYLLLKDMYEFAPRGEIEIKGKGLMSTWFLVQGMADSRGPAAMTRVPRKVAPEEESR